MFTSLEPKDHASRVLIFRAAQSSDSPLMEMEGKEMNVTDVMITPAEKVDPQDGQVIELVRVAVITKEGKVHDGFGKWAAKSIELLCTIFGDPPWPAGISLTVRKIKCNVGHTMALEPYVPEPAVQRRK